MLNFASPNNGKNGQALDRRPVSLSLLDGRAPRVRPRAFPERQKVMSKKITFKAGSKGINEPRLLGSIVEEMLHGNSPLAKGYRQYIASQENGEADNQGWHANTELGCDVKTLLRCDKRMQKDKEYLGILRLDSEAEIDDYLYRDAHMTFIETVRPMAGKRNPHVYVGKYITITRRDDGSLRPNFKPMPQLGTKMSPEYYAFEVYRELRQALKGLVEE